MKRKFLLFTTLIILCFLYIFNFPSLLLNKYSAYADSVEYTNILADLSKDELFNPNNYPVNSEDYSISVIQIAESSARELYIYVYQPCSPNEDLNATSINISKEIGEKLSYKNYSLTLLNSAGVFYKYKVNNFVVRQKVVRYYDISSIFRKWNIRYDNYSQGDNVITEIPFEVATRFSAYEDSNDNTIYCYTATDVVTITNKYNGFIRYTNGFNYIPDYTDSFFTCFSTDYEIDKLIEAEISFITCTYHKTKDLTGLVDGSYSPAPVPDSSDNFTSSGSPYDNYNGYTTWEYGPDIEHQLVLHSDSTEKIYVGYIFKSKYTWNQIESVSDFKSDKHLSQQMIEDIDNYQWVLNYWTADWTLYYDNVMATPITEHEKGTRVEDITILRLKFETNGNLFNIGCIDNKSNSSLVVSGTGISFFEKISNLVKTLLSILLFILLAIMIFPFLPTILNIVWWIIKNVLNFIIWIIKLPFKLSERKNNITKVEIIARKGGGKK